jgi:hypothetical protein
VIRPDKNVVARCLAGVGIMFFASVALPDHHRVFVQRSVALPDLLIHGLRHVALAPALAIAVVWGPAVRHALPVLTALYWIMLGAPMLYSASRAGRAISYGALVLAWLVYLTSGGGPCGWR